MILFKIIIPYDRYFSCSKVFYNKVYFNIVYNSEFSLVPLHAPVDQDRWPSEKTFCCSYNVTDNARETNILPMGLDNL